MKARRLVAAVAALLVCASAGVRAGEAAAGEAAAGAPAAPEMKTIKVQAKLYRDVDADSVYQAALMGIRADVRFQDTFDARLAVPRGMERLDLGPASYLVVLAFRTRTDLLCLVPSANPALLGRLLGVPSNLPIGPAALSLPLVLNPGQQITIEGTVVGTVRGQRYVLVDSVDAGLPGQAAPEREVHLFWPSQAEPRIITQPGQQAFQFPCTHVKDKTDSVTVSVQALTPDQLNAQLAALQGTLEAGVSSTKVYGQYTPRTVYRYAGSTQSINADFTDQVQKVLDPPPAQLASVAVLRAGYAAQVPVVRAFVMSGGPTILIPNTWPTVLQESAAMIPGETVRVHGTTVGPRGIYNCVVVDSLSFPSQREGAEVSAPWWVSIEWEGVGQPFVFWDYGQYSLAPLPCQNEKGQFESLNLLISQFREYQVPVQPATPEAKPAQPAPAARPEEPKAAVPNVETGTP